MSERRRPTILPPKPNPANAQPPDNTLAYLMVVLGAIALAVIAVIGVEIVRPNQDNSGITATIIAVVTPTVVAVLALIRGNQTSGQVQQVHHQINSRLDAWYEQAQVAADSAAREARAEGRLEGIEQAKVSETAASDVRDAHDAGKLEGIDQASETPTVPPKEDG